MRTAVNEQAIRATESALGIIDTLRAHSIEYLCEAAGLGVFMLSACIAGVLLAHPMSPIHQAIGSPLLRRAMAGVAMGVTLIAIVLSPAGKRSGAHLNPAITLNYWLLGKVRTWDAVFYVLSQFAGGAAGVLLAVFLIGSPIRHSAVNYVVTAPGPEGMLVAFWAEFAIALGMMYTVLSVSNHPRFAPYTAYFAAALVALYITFEEPLSGMSMNPARTLASAVSAREWDGLWVYFIAPPLAMLVAARLYTMRMGLHRVFCAKLHHDNDQPCIFRCNYGALRDDVRS